MTRNETHEQMVFALTEILTADLPDDMVTTPIAAEALASSLQTLGTVVAIKGLTANEEGDEVTTAFFEGMASLIVLILDSLSMVVGRREVENL
jgi:hypothetical protein